MQGWQGVRLLGTYGQALEDTAMDLRDLTDPLGDPRVESHQLAWLLQEVHLYLGRCTIQTLLLYHTLFHEKVIGLIFLSSWKIGWGEVMDWVPHCLQSAPTPTQPMVMPMSPMKTSSILVCHCSHKEQCWLEKRALITVPYPLRTCCVPGWTPYPFSTRR